MTEEGKFNLKMSFPFLKVLRKLGIVNKRQRLNLQLMYANQVLSSITGSDTATQGKQGIA